jgi:hypothetical protein
MTDVPKKKVVVPSVSVNNKAQSPLHHKQLYHLPDDPLVIGRHPIGQIFRSELFGDLDGRAEHLGDHLEEALHLVLLGVLDVIVTVRHLWDLEEVGVVQLLVVLGQGLPPARISVDEVMRGCMKRRQFFQNKFHSFESQCYKFKIKYIFITVGGL